ncbi:hypothetical protein SPHINGOT1_80254 [Sphingomonas sp. T1]|nr:hypothetical protein SPHINGOT1_80254 [Sphingomonas sp. T1]
MPHLRQIFTLKRGRFSHCGRQPDHDCRRNGRSCAASYLCHLAPIENVRLREEAADKTAIGRLWKGRIVTSGVRGGLTGAAT